MNQKLSTAFEKKLATCSEYMDSGFILKHLYDGAFIAGGAITSSVKGEKPKDFDVFFETEEAYRAVIGRLLKAANLSTKLELVCETDTKNPKLLRGVLVSKSETPLEQLLEDYNATPSAKFFLSANAVSVRKTGLQFVYRFIGEPEQVFSTFDYEHCKVYWKAEPWGYTSGKVVYCGQALEAIAKNQLLYTGGSRFVLAALMRLHKFSRRGWSVPISTYFTLTQSLQQLALSDPAVVREELLGFYGVKPTKLEQLLTDCTQENKKLDSVKLLKGLESL